MNHGLTPRARWRRLGRRLAALLTCARGASATEFAILVPILGALLTGTIDLAQFGNQGLVLDAAVRAGAAYAMTCSADSFNCSSGITTVIQGYATSLGSSVTVSFPNATSSTDPQYCAWDNSSTTAFSCSGAAPCSGAQCPMHVYVQIHAIWTLPAPLMPLGILPSSVSRTLTVRVS